MTLVTVSEDRRAPAELAWKQIEKRVRFLKPADQGLLQLVFRQHATHREIANLLSVPAGTITRRLQRLGARLHDPLVVNLVERPGLLPSEYRQLGIEYFLQGASIAELAELHQMSPHQVRKMIEYIRGWHRGRRG